MNLSEAILRAFKASLESKYDEFSVISQNIENLEERKDFGRQPSTQQEENKLEE